MPAVGIFSGAARSDRIGYWLDVERADRVVVPGVSRFGERNKLTGQQNFEDVPADSMMDGILLPTPPGKDYRLLKVVTQDADFGQLARLGNDRAPVFLRPGDPAVKVPEDAYAAILPEAGDQPGKPGNQDDPQLGLF